MYYTSTLIVRRHLPTRRLTLGWFLYLALPTHTTASMILPYTLWPEAICEAWQEAASATRPHDDEV